MIHRPASASVVACAVALLLCAPGAAESGEERLRDAGRFSSISVDSTRIVITVPVVVIGGDEELIAVWREGIDRAWNRGNRGRPFSICGRTLFFNPHFVPQPSEIRPRPSHTVYVEQVRPGQRFVSSVWHAIGTSPTYSPRTGHWGSDMGPHTAAHEFGHLLGLTDEYAENDTNRNGVRDEDEAPFPDISHHPDAVVSLMASTSGLVLPRHITEILRIHGVDSAQICAVND